MTIQRAGTAYVGFENNVFSADTARDTFSVNTQVAAFPKENLLNWQPHSLFKSDGISSPNQTNIRVETTLTNTVNYIGIAAHNLGDVASQLRILQDGTLIKSVTTFDGNGVIFVQFPTFDASADELTVTVVHTGRLEIGVLFVGLRTWLYSPPLLETTLPIWSGNDARTNRNRAGQIIGRSVIDRPAPFTIVQPAVPWDWARDTWRSLLDHAERDPFFYSWAAADYVDDAVLMSATMPLTRPVEIDKNLVRCDLAGVVYPE